MFKPILMAVLGGLTASLLIASAPARAEGARQTLGFGHFFDNDVIGDGKDRWQSGSYTLSWLRGKGWSGQLPAQPFAVMEYRLGGSILAPENLVTPAAGDRRYVAKSQFSAHTQFAPRAGLEADLGLGFVWTGPSNGLSQLQEFLHRAFSAPAPRAADTQLGNHVYPYLNAELARPVSLGGALGGAQLRPFVEARAGEESYLRAGADLAFGASEEGALWLRDEVTGQRYPGIAGTSSGRTGFVLGADIAHVFDSPYLAKADGVRLVPTRKRLRAGLSTRLGAGTVFYGLTWLSREFESQPEAQLTGSAQLRIRF